MPGNFVRYGRYKINTRIYFPSAIVNGDNAAEIIPLADAANIDLKCFSPYNYKNILGGSLTAVKDFIKAAASPFTHPFVTSTLAMPRERASVMQFIKYSA